MANRVMEAEQARSYTRARCAPLCCCGCSWGKPCLMLPFLFFAERGSRGLHTGVKGTCRRAQERGDTGRLLIFLSALLADTVPLFCACLLKARLGRAQMAAGSLMPFRRVVCPCTTCARNQERAFVAIVSKREPLSCFVLVITETLADPPSEYPLDLRLCMQTTNL